MKPFANYKTLYNATVIVDSGIKKSNIVTSIVHIQKENCIGEQIKIQTINVTSVEAKLIAICIGFIPAIKDKNNHNIAVITDFLSAARKVLKSHISLF